MSEKRGGKNETNILTRDTCLLSLLESLIVDLPAAAAAISTANTRLLKTKLNWRRLTHAGGKLQEKLKWD